MNQVDDETVNSLIKCIDKNVGMVARYYKLKSRILGIDDLKDYDRYAPLFQDTHRCTYEEAKKMVLEAYNQFSPEATEISLRYGWQLAAAFYAALALEPPADVVGDTDVDIDALIDDAVACGDEHAIKALEVCLGAHTRRADPVYLVAARETTAGLVRSGFALP